MRVLPQAVAPPTAPAVTLTQLKAHLRIDDDSEDVQLRVLGAAAAARIERMLGRPLQTTTVAATFDAWPADSVIQLLMPVRSVDNIVADGTPVTGWLARTSAGGVTRVRPMTGQSWPSLAADASVTLQATAGFDVIPADVVQAICMTVGHYYANREATVATGMGNDIKELPLGVAALLAPHRWRWLG